ncbi:MAG: ABC transporter ATP-binding protein [Anaerolineales bacterium]|jgi:ABC-type multidrug transport system fused ATPase/permease subunit
MIKLPFQDYWELLAKHIRSQKGRFTLLAVLLLCSIGLQVVNPQIMRYFIDTAQLGEATAKLTEAALIFIAVALAQQVVGVGAAYVGENVAWTATNALRAELAQHCLRLDMSFHNDISPGELIERVDGDVSELSNFFSQLVIRVVGNLLLIGGVLLALFWEDWLLGLAFSIFVGITLAVLNRVRAVAIPHQKAVREASADLFGYLEERLAGTEDIRSSGAVDFVLLGLYKLMHNMMKHWRKAMMMILVVIASTVGLYAIGSGGAFVSSYYLFTGGTITIGTAYLIVHYINFLRRPIRELTQQVENMQNIGAATERLIELRGIESKLADGHGAYIPPGALSLDFKQVSFGYVEEERVLDSLTFTLSPGSVLGLLGRTGSGKTTLARLVFRLYDLTEGEINLGDVNIQKAKIRELRERVAIVTQDVQLFQATVRDNLTFFDRGIPDDEILRVIEELELSEWFNALPKGLDTKLETSGRSLSAGEGQLLAFTRVFLRDPGLVILDEASSRLDPATEQLIERAVDKLLKDRTAIIIAHRLGTVERADDILILESGNLVEHGKRLELAANPSSRFYNLLQAGLEEVLV